MVCATLDMSVQDSSSFETEEVKKKMKIGIGGIGNVLLPHDKIVNQYPLPSSSFMPYLDENSMRR